jgi:hypothetical protein
MIKILFPVFIILFTSCSSTKYVVFRHIGAINKPINCLIVTNTNKFSKKVCELQEEYVIEDEVFRQLEKYVLEKHIKPSNISTSHSFGSFQVQHSSKGTYVIEGSQNAIAYFSNLIKLLNSNGSPDLAEIVEKNILVRIRGIQ